MDYTALIKSGIIYLSCFLVSIGLFRLVEISYKKKAKESVERTICLFIAILIPSLIAAFRGNDVGVDVGVYVVPNMNTAHSFKTFSGVCQGINAGTEYLYALIVYIISRFTSDAGPLLFVLQFLTIAPITAAVVNLREKISISIAMSTYFFLFYNNTLNMMRQSVSCAFIILAVSYFLDNNRKNKFKIIISFVCAVLFHKSGFIGIICIMGLYWVHKMRLKTIIKIILFCCIMVFPLIMTQLFELLVSLGILTGSFITYGEIFIYKSIDKDWYVELTAVYTLVNILFVILIIAIPNVYLIGTELTKENDVSFFRTVTFFGAVFYLVILISMETMYGGRLTLFFEMFNIIFLPYTIKEPSVSLKKIIAYAFLVVYWAVWIMRLGWSGSNLYEFRFGF